MDDQANVLFLGYIAMVKSQNSPTQKKNENQANSKEGHTLSESVLG